MTFDTVVQKILAGELHPGEWVDTDEGETLLVTRNGFRITYENGQREECVKFPSLQNPSQKQS